MTQRIVTRGSRVFLSFVFYDENGDVATCDSAEVQLTYPGNSDFETAVVTLTEDDGTWSGEWLSNVARPGWVEFHAHAVAGEDEFTEDGRFRLTGNRANFDHEEMPTTGTLSSDYGGTAPAPDYS